MVIGEQLHFDVPRPFETALEIDRRIAEGGACFRSRGADALGRSAGLLTTRMPFPPPPATALTITGKPICRRPFDDRRIGHVGGKRLFGAGHHGHAGSRSRHVAPRSCCPST